MYCTKNVSASRVPCLNAVCNVLPSLNDWHGWCSCECCSSDILVRMAPSMVGSNPFSTPCNSKQNALWNSLALSCLCITSLICYWAKVPTVLIFAQTWPISHDCSEMASMTSFCFLCIRMTKSCRLLKFVSLPTLAFWDSFIHFLSTWKQCSCWTACRLSCCLGPKINIIQWKSHMKIFNKPSLNQYSFSFAGLMDMERLQAFTAGVLACLTVLCYAALEPAFLDACLRSFLLLILLALAFAARFRVTVEQQIFRQVQRLQELHWSWYS